MLDRTSDREGEAATIAAEPSLARNSPPTEIPVRPRGEVDVDQDNDEDEHGSLLDDVSSLYEDGKAYVGTELAFQKTRAKYTASAGSKVAIFGIAALLLVNLALVALAIGAILSLETLVGPLAATLIVTAVILIGAGVLGFMAKNKVAEISRVFSGDRS